MHEQTKSRSAAVAWRSPCAEAKLAHTAALGAEVYNPAPNSGRVGVPYDIVPYAKFVFVYRSLDMLRLDGVAPPEPAPVGPVGGPSVPKVKAEPVASRKRPPEAAEAKPDKKPRVVIDVRARRAWTALMLQLDSD